MYLSRDVTASLNNYHFRINIEDTRDAEEENNDEIMMRMSWKLTFRKLN